MRPAPKFASYSGPACQGVQGTKRGDGVFDLSTARNKKPDDVSRPPKPEKQQMRLHEHQKHWQNESFNPALNAAKPSFVVDRLGDPQNERYQSLDRSHIPDYKRPGQARALGQRISRYQPSYDDVLRPESKIWSQARQSSHSELELIIPEPRAIGGTDVNDDYLPFEDRLASLETTWKTVEDPIAGSHAIMRWRDHSREREGRNVFGVKTRTDAAKATDSQLIPENIQRGLGFGDVTSTLTSGTYNGAPSIHAKERLSKCQKARQEPIQNPVQETQLMAIMREATQLLSEDELAAKWASMITEHSDDIGLWQHYLDYKQSTARGFTYDTVRQAYLDFLLLLDNKRSHVFEDLSEEISLFRMQLLTILRLTVFTREAGFREYAFSIWQSLLEYLLFRPFSNLGSNQSCENLQAFQEYWDSEVPRIGEPGAEGWNHFTSTSRARSPRRRERHDQPTSLNAWAGTERIHEAASQYSARTKDDIAHNDPFALIFFSDIEPCLFEMPEKKCWPLLVDMFLTFCNMPVIQTQEDVNDEQWASDIFVNKETLLNDQTQSDDFMSASFHNYRLDQHTLYAERGQWFQAFPSDPKETARRPIEPEFVLRVLLAIIDAGYTNGEDLSEYCLAFELQISPSTVRRRAKRLLKREPSNLRLYNCLALLEDSLGQKERGEKTIITALGMSQTFTAELRRERMLLWPTLLWRYIKVGDVMKALHLICLLDSTDLQEAVGKINVIARPEPANIDTMEQRLTALRQESLHSKSSSLVIALMECVVLLAYLKEPQTLHAARRSFHSNLECLAQAPAFANVAECLHQSFAYLIYRHMTHASFFNATEVHGMLAESLFAFPENSIFHALYGRVESKLPLERLQTNAQEFVEALQPRGRESSIPYICRIDVEQARTRNSLSGINVLRGLYESAIVTATVAQRPGLWARFFLLEASRGTEANAKIIFYRGLHQCPWSKKFALLAFTHLHREGVLPDSELLSIYQLMEDRGLRVHVPYIGVA